MNWTSRGPVCGERPGCFVITSYSIHYTKLYELLAADFAEKRGDTTAAACLRESADNRNELIESLTYVTGTELAQRHGVEGYYIRIAPPNCLPGDDIAAAPLRIRNQPEHKAIKRAGESYNFV